MNNPMSADMDFASPACDVCYGEEITTFAPDYWCRPTRLSSRPTLESLRNFAWEIGERQAAAAYMPPTCQVVLAMVNPGQGFAHWRILPQWIDQLARRKGDGWHHSRMVLRLYDVTCIHFNGFNAHQIRDFPLNAPQGQLFFSLPRAGTCQLAEVGFLLRSGEFVPGARSQVASFAPDVPSPHGSNAALLVTPRGRIEEVHNLWDQERILHERRRPRLRKLCASPSFPGRTRRAPSTTYPRVLSPNWSPARRPAVMRSMSSCPP